MKNTVIIKGIQSGIIVILDEKIEYEKLKKDVETKFKESSKFLGKTDLAISFEGRKLSDEQVTEILDIISSNTQLNIVCVLSNDKNKDNLYKKQIEENITAVFKDKKEKIEKELKAVYDKKIKELNATRDKEEKALIEKIKSEDERKLKKAVEEAKGLASQNAIFHKGSLRSGQVLNTDRSVVIIGDVNYGANVTSKGNIVVLGTLYGNVHAGCDGNDKAFIIALNMKPTQIRIGANIARSSDSSDSGVNADTMIAYVDDGNIYIEKMSKNVIKELEV
ncbi:MAG: septum site-determining protein MinC [Lachnospiraceae bacterium]|nr:septum site-determining protein MinC [Lachnospiraceae bacterium]